MGQGLIRQGSVSSARLVESELGLSAGGAAEPLHEAGFILAM